MLKSLFVAAASVLLLSSAPAVLADTPADCKHADLVGTWTFSQGPLKEKTQSPFDCSAFTVDPDREVTVKLVSPNLAYDSDNNQGNWTMIYNQGFEVWLNNRVYFAFSQYDDTVDPPKSHCDQTMNGWAHDLNGQNWSCWAGKKTKSADELAVEKTLEEEAADLFRQKQITNPLRLNQVYEPNQEYLDAINNAQSMFTVGHYPELWEGKTVGEIERMLGSYRKPVPVAELQRPASNIVRSAKRDAVQALPKSFDWRNVDGVNYVSPVRSQASCGSCYVFASLGMLESRIRIKSNNELRPDLSEQESVSCSNYAQGCNGGFSYLIAGKQGRDYGFVEESCVPYLGKDTKCMEVSAECNKKRWMTSEYYYTGGYFGMSNEQNLKEELLANGPVSVSFMVKPGFKDYTGGVYSYEAISHLNVSFDPFVEVNHAVLLVGWGETDKGVKYWTVKNSWGPKWGEGGYFRILRGSKEKGGECGIESHGEAAIPILP